MMTIHQQKELKEYVGQWVSGSHIHIDFSSLVIPSFKFLSFLFHFWTLT